MINDGDLVMVTRVDHACKMHFTGRIFTYESVPTPHIGVKCATCGTLSICAPGAEPMSYYGAAFLKNGVKKRFAMPARWLTKIEPLREDQMLRDTEVVE